MCATKTPVISNLTESSLVKDIAQTVFRCAETIKKTSSANINTVAHRQKTKVFLGFFYNLFRARAQNFHEHTRDNEVKRVLVARRYGARFSINNMADIHCKNCV